MKITHSDHESWIFAWLHLNEFENFFHWSRNDASLWISNIVFESFHCMGFSGTCLSIGNYGGIVSLQYWNDALFGRIFINEFLGRILIVNVVKCEVLPNTQVWIHIHVFLPLLFGYFCPQILHDAARLVVASNLDYGSKLAPVNFLSLQGRSYSDHDLEVLIGGARENRRIRHVHLILFVLLSKLLRLLEIWVATLVTISCSTVWRAHCSWTLPHINAHIHIVH